MCRQRQGQRVGWGPRIHENRRSREGRGRFVLRFRRDIGPWCALYWQNDTRLIGSDREPTPIYRKSNCECPNSRSFAIIRSFCIPTAIQDPSATAGVQRGNGFNGNSVATTRLHDGGTRFVFPLVRSRPAGLGVSISSPRRTKAPAKVEDFHRPPPLKKWPLFAGSRCCTWSHPAYANISYRGLKRASDFAPQRDIGDETGAMIGKQQPSAQKQGTRGGADHLGNFIIETWKPPDYCPEDKT